jgi:protoheme IX farnesyltransferase
MYFMLTFFKLLINIFKVRISITIMLCAISGAFIMPNNTLSWFQILILAVSTFLASAGVSAFNQYFERDLDALMPRTAERPFVTGKLSPSLIWPIFFMLITSSGIMLSYLMINPYSAFYNFLGAFFYGCVYTIWLKRKSVWNIVIGGLAGSFATLAGSAAVNTSLSPEAIILAVILFLWTPPHFWSLAMAIGEDYKKAKIPMLPNIISYSNTSYIILFHTIILVLVSLLPVVYSMGWLYLAGAILGGGYFIWTSLLLTFKQTKDTAMKNFFASFIQLGLLLVLIIANGMAPL